MDAEEPPAVNASSDPAQLPLQPRGTKSPTSKRGRWWEPPVLAIVAVAVAMLVKTFIVQPFYIPSGSMVRTLNGCTGCSGD